MGRALYPNVDDTQTFFMYVTTTNGGVRSRVERWPLSSDGPSATFDSVLINNIRSPLYHNYGRLRFGPDKNE